MSLVLVSRYGGGCTAGMVFSMSRARPVAILLTVLIVLGVPAPARARGGAAGPGLTVAVDAPAGEAGAMSVVLNPGGSATLTRTIATPVVPPRPDVVLLADTTSSMGRAIANVHTNADLIMDQLSEVQPDAQFAAAEFGDLSDGADRAFHVDSDLTADRELVRQGTAGWQPVGGGDLPEDGLNALFELAGDTVSWRSGSSRIVVMFSDAATHDPSNGHSLEDTVAALVAKEIRVVFVDVATTDDSGSATRTRQFTRITDATGGVLLKAPDSTQVTAKILEGVKAIPVTVRAGVDGCDPGITATVTPSEQTVDSGTPVSFAVTAQAAESARDGDYACGIDFAMDGHDESGRERLSVIVTGAAPDQPVLGSDATVVDFGTQDLGLPGVPRTVTLTNGGDVPLTLTTRLMPSAAPGVFTVENSSCGPSLPPAQHCVLRIAATARTAGTAETVLRLSSTTETGGSAEQPLTLRVTGRVPTVQLNPGVGRPGQVVAAVGRGFPPGAVVTVAWSVGSGAVSAIADASGEFSVPLLVFSGVAAGPRTVTATAPGLAAGATATFLADGGSWQPDMPAQGGRPEPGGAAQKR